MHALHGAAPLLSRFAASPRRMALWRGSAGCASRASGTAAETSGSECRRRQPVRESEDGCTADTSDSPGLSTTPVSRHLDTADASSRPSLSSHLPARLPDGFPAGLASGGSDVTSVCCRDSPVRCLTSSFSSGASSLVLPYPSWISPPHVSLSFPPRLPKHRVWPTAALASAGTISPCSFRRVVQQRRSRFPPSSSFSYPRLHSPQTPFRSPTWPLAISPRLASSSAFSTLTGAPSSPVAEGRLTALASNPALPLLLSSRSGSSSSCSSATLPVVATPSPRLVESNSSASTGGLAGPFCPVRVSEARLRLLQLASEATSLHLSCADSIADLTASGRAAKRASSGSHASLPPPDRPALPTRIEDLSKQALSLVDAVADSSRFGGASASAAVDTAAHQPDNTTSPDAQESDVCSLRDDVLDKLRDAAASVLLPGLVALLPPFASSISEFATADESARLRLELLPESLSSLLKLMIRVLQSPQRWASLTDDEFAATAHALRVFGCVDTLTAAAAADALLHENRLRQVSLRRLAEIASSLLDHHVARRIEDTRLCKNPPTVLLSSPSPDALIRRAAKAAQARLLSERDALLDAGILVRAWQTAASLSVLSHASHIRAEKGFLLLLERMKEQQKEGEGAAASAAASVLPEDELAALPLALAAVETPEERLFLWAAEQMLVRLGGPSLRQIHLALEESHAGASGRAAGSTEDRETRRPDGWHGKSRVSRDVRTRPADGRRPSGALGSGSGRGPGGSRSEQVKERALVHRLLHGMALWERIGPPGMQQQALPVFCQAILLPCLPLLPSTVLLHLLEAATSTTLATSVSRRPAFYFSSFLPSAEGLLARRAAGANRREAKQRLRQVLQEREDTLRRLAAGALGLLLLESSRRARFEKGQLFRLLRATRRFAEAQMLPKHQRLAQLLSDKSDGLLEVEAALAGGLPLLYRDIALQLRLVSRSAIFFPSRSGSLVNMALLSTLPASNERQMPVCGVELASAERDGWVPVAAGRSSLRSSSRRELSSEDLSGENSVERAARAMIHAATSGGADDRERGRPCPIATSELVDSLRDVTVLTGLLPLRRARQPHRSAPALSPAAEGAEWIDVLPEGHYLLDVLQELLPLLSLAVAPMKAATVSHSPQTSSEISEVVTSCSALLLRLVAFWNLKTELERCFASLGFAGGLPSVDRGKLACCRLLVLQLALLSYDSRVDPRAAALALRALLACLHRVPDPALSDHILVHLLPILPRCFSETASANGDSVCPAANGDARRVSASLYLVPVVSGFLRRVMEATATSTGGAQASGGDVGSCLRACRSVNSEAAVEAGELHPDSDSSDSGREPPVNSATDAQCWLSTEKGLTAVVPSLAAAAWLNHQCELLCGANGCAHEPNTGAAGDSARLDVGAGSETRLHGCPADAAFVAEMHQCTSRALRAAKRQFRRLPSRDVRLLEMHLRELERERGRGLQRAASASSPFIQQLQGLLADRWGIY
ncbi:hypothetical protein BESB_023670 [Besnoitia besnoiti]|uniref:Uncharacterized protein n=1 Tax=Besnoitia besnoiti TaxID=94643 RepID=A0A2A9M1L1_BESBE|nr:hypothetical protein BESB_023670 [Besnoitia besnoiti]PFH31875.1 hypothetical protein BESB_023670 [Besnoitia besnoiti]